MYSLSSSNVHDGLAGTDWKIFHPSKIINMGTVHRQGLFALIQAQSNRSFVPFRILPSVMNCYEISSEIPHMAWAQGLPGDKPKALV